MTTDEKLDKLIRSFDSYCGKVDILSSNLYSNPNTPGHKGDIEEIKDHLKSHNNFAARLAKVETTVKIILLLILSGGGAYGLERWLS